MGIRLIPPRHLTDLSPVIYCEIDSSDITTDGALRTPRRRVAHHVLFVRIDQARCREAQMRRLA